MEYTILTNENFFSYKDYCNYCKEMDMEPAPENSGAFYDWSEEEIQTNLECDLEMMEESKAEKENQRYFITGHFQTWNGIKVVCSNKTYTILEAVKTLINTRYQSYFTISLENGTITAKIAHHDGTNYFTVHRLSSKGEKAVSAAIANGKINTFELKPYHIRKAKIEDIF